LRYFYRKNRGLWVAYAVCRVKIALQAIFGGFMREAQQTARKE
jgi:hypothetical protein